MNYLFVSAHTGSPWGGSEELWSRAAVQLVEVARVNAYVQPWRKPVPQVVALRDRGVSIVSQPGRLQRRIRKLLARFGKGEPVVAWSSSVLRRLRPDLLILSCGGFAEALWWTEAASSCAVRYVIISQAVGERMWPDDDYAQAVRKAYAGAEAVLFVSEANRGMVETMIGSSIPNARVVRNPFKVPYDSRVIYPKSASFHPACVARLEPAAKGQDILLKILALEKWRKRGINISFYGAGPNEHSLKLLARRLGLNSAHFRGFAADVIKIWKEHPFLILPSRYEGLPLALVEAMLCGRTAVATAVAGNPEVIDNNETGFLAEFPTVESVDEALERAWHAQERLESMGEAARARIRAKVSSDPVSDLAVLLQDLAGTVERNTSPARPDSKSILARNSTGSI